MRFISLPSTLKFPFGYNRIQSFFPILRLYPFKEDFKNLVHGQDFTGRKRCKISPNWESGCPDTSFLRFVEAEVLDQDRLRRNGGQGKMIIHFISIVIADATNNVDFLSLELRKFHLGVCGQIYDSLLWGFLG